jgi:uncharacterized Zn finger protein
MIQVRFTTFELDADTREWVELPVAEVIADGEEVTISGPRADWISLDISIVDPETAERVTRAEDAERWARLLPFAYRDGQITVTVTETAAAKPAGGAFHYAAAA